MKKRLTFSFLFLLMLSIVLSACASKSRLTVMKPGGTDVRHPWNPDMVAEEQYAIEEGRNLSLER